MATTVLSKTFGTATNRKKWTMSVWLKKASPISEGTIFSSYSTGTTSNYSAFRDNGDTTYEFVENDGSYTINLRPTLKLRDTAAWYHLVLAYDSTQSVAADRVNYYVNGVLQTAWGTETYPTLNQESGINQAALHTIGKNTATDNSYFNGVMAHFHFIDGLQYAASTFGETDSTSGIWVAKTGPSVTYGNNGFFLKFQDTAAFGDDSSGNTNDFALSGTMTQTKDTPDNNFCTMNPLDNFYQAATFSNGDNTVTTGSGIYTPNTGTIGMTTGKWYWECKPTSGSSPESWLIGVQSTQATGAGAELGNYAGDWGYYGSGTIRNNNANTAYGDAYVLDDVIGVALDVTNSKLYFSINGVWQNSGVPTSGATGTGAVSITMATNDQAFGAWFPSFCYYDSGTGTISVNFGNGYFGTTSSGTTEADDAGIGVFKYDVPAGYYALCTNNLGDQS